GKQDGLTAAIKTCIAKWLDVVVADDVGGDEPTGAERVSVGPPVIVMPADNADLGRQRERQLRLLASRVKGRGVGEPVALDVDPEHGGGGRRRAVGGDEARGRLPGRVQPRVPKR